MLKATVLFGTLLLQVLTVLYRISRKNQELPGEIHKQKQFFTFCSKISGFFGQKDRGNSPKEGKTAKFTKKLPPIRSKKVLFFVFYGRITSTAMILMRPPGRICSGRTKRKRKMNAKQLTGKQKLFLCAAFLLVLMGLGGRANPYVHRPVPG